MLRPYNRSLDPQDYEFLPHAAPLRAYAAELVAAGVPHREWCEHRLWEYASVMQQLEELGVPRDAAIVDAGSGGSFFPPYLATRGGYPNVTVTDWRGGALADGMDYGDCLPHVEAQRKFTGATLRFVDCLLEEMRAFPDAAFDVTMCISSIEHVVTHHARACAELARITKPGGLLFVTSDYFRDLAQWEASPSRFMQHTPYTEAFVAELPALLDAEFVGPTDFAYRGDFVHNHSFVNLCLRRKG